MTICAICGDIEVYYVLACGDPDVGESKVLVYGGAEKDLIQAEIRETDAAFGALEAARDEGDTDAIANAQDHLAGMLEGYLDPTDSLPSRHLVQAYSVTQQRWTRIRSDKMKNHWRRYGISPQLRDAQPMGDGQNQLDKSALNQAWGAIKDQIAQDFSKGFEFKGTFIKEEFDVSLLAPLDDKWEKWINAVNDSLSMSVSHGNHDFSAGAQLLRGYAGYGVDLGYNPKTNTYGLTAQAEARAALAEGQARYTGYPFGRDGWEVLIPYGANGSVAGRQEALHFGYFRCRIELDLHGMLGASIMATAGIAVSPGPNGTVQVQPAPAGAKGEIAAGAFVGVEAGGSLKGGLDWQNPGWREQNEDGSLGPLLEAKWAELFTIGGGLAGSAGAGGEVNLFITLEGGRLMFRAQAQVVIGLGAKGTLQGAVDFKNLYEFIMYLYSQLNDNDFSYLEFMDESAFHFAVGAVLLAIETGIDLATASIDAVQRGIAAIRSEIEASNEAEEYAIHIKSRPSALIFAPPEAKGMILHKLSQRYWDSFEEHQEAAILTVVGTMQSKAEWDKVCARINPMGIETNKAAGMYRLNRILDGGSQRKFDDLVRAINSLQPTTMYAGQPIIVRNIA